MVIINVKFMLEFVIGLRGFAKECRVWVGSRFRVKNIIYIWN